MDNKELWKSHLQEHCDVMTFRRAGADGEVHTLFTDAGKFLAANSESMHVEEVALDYSDEGFVTLTLYMHCRDGAA